MQWRAGTSKHQKTGRQIQPGRKEEQNSVARDQAHLADDGVYVQALLASGRHSAWLVPRLWHNTVHTGRGHGRVGARVRAEN